MFCCTNPHFDISEHRDYTYYTKAAAGFSTAIDKMLQQAAKDFASELALFEMHIRDDLVYNIMVLPTSVTSYCL